MSGSESLLNDEFDFSSPFDNMDDMDRLKSPLNDEEGLPLGNEFFNFHNNSNDSVSDFSDTHAGTTNFSWDNPNKNQNSFQHDEYNWSWIEMNSFFKQLNQSNDKKDKSGDSNNFDTNVDIKNEKDKIDMAKNKKEKKNKGSPKNKLFPVLRKLNGFKKFRSNNKLINGKRLMHSSSQPKFGINKTKLKPIGKRNTEKILANSKSQNVLMNNKNNKNNK